MIDLNRPPDDTPMYPGRPTPSCVRHDSSMANRSIARALRRMRPKLSAAAPLATVSRCLRNALQVARERHGYALLGQPQHPLADPWLFDGKLPDLNLGTASGASCAADLRERLAQRMRRQRSLTQPMAASRAATSRATTANRAAHSRRADGDVSVALHAGSAAVCLSARKRRQRAAAAAADAETMLDWKPQ